MSAADHWLAGIGRGGGVTIALLAALLLGLRHATDPDHLTAVSTLALSDGRRGARGAGTLGLAWGLGHASSLVALGMPALLLRHYLPDAAQQAAELTIGCVIVLLAIRLLWRWRRGWFRSDPDADGRPQPHGHGHHHPPARSPLAAFGIGLVHGMGGTAGVTVLLIAAIPHRIEAAGALVLFAAATAVSMCLISAAFGGAVSSRMLARRLEATVPLLGAASLTFGVFYALTALAAV